MGPNNIMLGNISAKVTGLLSDKRIVIGIILAVIFICAAIYSYRTYAVPKINPSFKENKEFIQGGDGPADGADLFFFYTTWCPHCKTAMPVWSKLKESTPAYNGVRLNYVEVDCDKDKALAEKYDVSGYPTIKLLYKGKVIEYDAKPDLDTLNRFLDSSLK